MNAEQAKLIIVGGAPRSGKTTVARELSEELKLSRISIDSIVHAFEKTQPEAKIRHLGEDDWGVCDRVAPFLVEQTRWHIQHGIPVIVDGYHLKPETISSNWEDFSFRAVFMGYPNSSGGEQLKTIRGNEKSGDWTLEISDSELLKLLDRFVESSRQFQRMCLQAELPFIDVGCDIESGVQRAKEILKEIKQG